MKKLLGWALVCQLLVIILGAQFYRSVRSELGPAQIRQGMEVAHHRLLDELREKDVGLPEDLDTPLPNKEALVSPGLIEFGQTATLAIPAVILQALAVGLTGIAFLRMAPAATVDPESTGRNQIAEQAGDGDAYQRPC